MHTQNNSYYREMSLRCIQSNTYLWEDKNTFSAHTLCKVIFYNQEMIIIYKFYLVPSSTCYSVVLRIYLKDVFCGGAEEELNT